MWRPECLSQDTWSSTTALRIIPLLVSVAESGGTITYGELDREIVRRGWGHHVLTATYAHACGNVAVTMIDLGDHLRMRIPPLNVLVVNKDTGVPGDGCDYFIKKYLRRSQAAILTAETRKILSERTNEEIYHFPYWGRVLDTLGLKAIQPSRSAQRTYRFHKAVTSGWSNEGESPEHQRLKEYIRDHPSEFLRSGSGWTGKIEKVLPSGDKVDVWFKGHHRIVCFEAKAANANDADISRGIFQCIKYRSVVWAQQKANGDIPNGQARACDRPADFLRSASFGQLAPG